ncbi:BON domain-containing protein [Hymenobacter sp. 15J16-1T3B]|uniref:BON domain-containing protein n=1 Tax=Hymenobacter sp. 15J16-1T3B TaxID=2886941 RepID=UPI001D10F3E4|nr:BON domain-containing protein [Hymenobacter sp. 15J16-1T3B]MCC3156683.1 BON domain-containing protein [Hymenobacter sp. 15J16-1T3B]
MLPASEIQPPRPASDAELAHAVRRLYAQFPTRTGAAPIRVAVARGIVHLTGFTRHLLGLECAVALAQSVAGVRGVVSELRLRETTVPDAILHRRLTALLTDTRLPYVRVAVQQATVTFTGTVDSWAAKQALLRQAKRLPGVWQVQDQLACPFRLSDADAAWAGHLPAPLTPDGPGAMRRRPTATGAAAEVSPAFSNAQRVPDEDGEQAILDAWQLDSRLGPERPALRVQHGVATLTGAVGTVQARQAAEQDARNAVGIWHVNNHLRVWPRQLPGDEPLRRALQAAQAADATVAALPVHWLLDHGRAIVRGVVPTPFAKTRLAELAGSIPGVLSVVNHLRVQAPERPLLAAA